MMMMKIMYIAIERETEKEGTNERGRAQKAN